MPVSGVRVDMSIFGWINRQLYTHVKDIDDQRHGGQSSVDFVGQMAVLACGDIDAAALLVESHPGEAVGIIKLMKEQKDRAVEDRKYREERINKLEAYEKYKSADTC